MKRELMTRDDLETWLASDETKKVFEFIEDIINRLKDEVIGFNQNTGRTTPITAEQLALVNHLIGQIEAFNVITNLSYDTFKLFYYEQKQEEEENE